MKVSGMVVISLSRAVRIDSVGGGWKGLKRIQHPFSNIRRNRLQSSDEVSQKACGVVIPFVQRQPGDRSFTICDPFADQRGFTKAGGGRDEGQFAVQNPRSAARSGGGAGQVLAEVGGYKVSWLKLAWTWIDYSLSLTKRLPVSSAGTRQLQSHDLSPDLWALRNKPYHWVKVPAVQPVRLGLTQ